MNAHAVLGPRGFETLIPGVVIDLSIIADAAPIFVPTNPLPEDWKRMYHSAVRIEPVEWADWVKHGLANCIPYEDVVNWATEARALVLR